MKLMVIMAGVAGGFLLASGAHASTFDEALKGCFGMAQAVTEAELETTTPQVAFCRAEITLAVRGTQGDALPWYRHAAEAGFAPAQYMLGVAYRDGDSVSADEAVALDWLLKAAEQGLADAQNDYAFEFFYGKHGTPEDPEKALPWLRKAAEQGYMHSQTLLAEAYFQGKGVEKDHVAALAWYRKAADQGHPYAMFVLGQMYMTGDTVGQDYDQAVALMKKAAEKGIGSAALQLAYIYAEKPALANPVEAMTWFEIYVAMSGDAEPERMKTLKASMKPEDLTLAKARAAVFRIKK